MGCDGVSRSLRKTSALRGSEVVLATWAPASPARSRVSASAAGRTPQARGRRCCWGMGPRSESNRRQEGAGKAPPWESRFGPGADANRTTYKNCGACERPPGDVLLEVFSTCRAALAAYLTPERGGRGGEIGK